MKKDRKHRFSIIKTNRYKKTKRTLKLQKIKDPWIDRNTEQTTGYGKNGHRILSQYSLQSVRLRQFPK